MPSDFASDSLREAIYYQSTGNPRSPHLSGQNLRSAIHAVASAQLMVVQALKESGTLRDGAMGEVEPLLASLVLDLAPEVSG